MAALNPERFAECQRQPQLFLVEMEKWPENSNEWFALAGLFVSACAVRLEQLDFALQLAEDLCRRRPNERHETMVALVRSRMALRPSGGA